jgi:hypothetical protein
MEFTIILVCSLYYLVCFYVGHKIWLSDSTELIGVSPIGTMLLIVFVAITCPVVVPFLIIIRGWLYIHEK